MKKFKLLLFLLLLTLSQLYSQDWKIYKIGNYTYIENLVDEQLIEGGASTIEFRKLLASDTSYRIFKDGIDQLNFAIDVTDMQDVNGITFTSTTFKAFKESNSGASQDVFIQDQTTEIVDFFFHMDLNDFTISSNTIINTNTFEANPSHNIIAGNTLCFIENLNASQFTVINVVTNIITIDSPFDRVYTTSGTFQHHTPNMSVNGSITPKIFILKPGPGIKWDIIRITLVIEDASAMDFSTFGSIAALTYGCVLRKKDGVFKNIFNWKTNGEFISRSFDFVIQEKTGGGLHAFTSRSTFGGQSKRGVVIRLDGDLNDELQIIIQDDIRGNDNMMIIGQGHVVQN